MEVEIFAIKVAITIMIVVILSLLLWIVVLERRVKSFVILIAEFAVKETKLHLITRNRIDSSDEKIGYLQKTLERIENE